MGIIEQADRIVGIEYVRNWASCFHAAYRRGAYIEWIGNHAKMPEIDDNVGFRSSVEQLAAEVVRIDAASRPKPPDDGLPPGPWHRSACGTIHDAGGELLWPGRSRAMAEATVDHIVRCGSPAVRRLLAAFEVTETKQDGSMGLCCTDSGVCFHVWHTEPLRDHSSVICWLTPRSKP